MLSISKRSIKSTPNAQETPQGPRKPFNAEGDGYESSELQVQIKTTLKTPIYIKLNFHFLDIYRWFTFNQLWQWKAPI